MVIYTTSIKYIPLLSNLFCTFDIFIFKLKKMFATIIKIKLKCLVIYSSFKLELTLIAMIGQVRHLIILFMSTYFNPSLTLLLIFFRLWFIGQGKP